MNGADLYRDYEIALQYLDSPDISDNDRAALHNAVWEMQRRMDVTGRMARRGRAHAHGFSPIRQIEALTEQAYKQPFVPIYDDPEQNELARYQAAEAEAVRQFSEHHPEYLPPEPSWGEQAWDVTKAIGQGLWEGAPDMLAYMTPVESNRRGIQDFGKTMRQFMAARDVEPLSAMGYLPQLALDGIQAAVPIIPSKALAQQGTDTILKYLNR